MKKVGIVLLGIILTVALFFGIAVLSFGSEYVGLQFHKFFGKEYVEADREIFKESTAYIEGLADDIVKYKLDLTKESDPIVRKAIIETIVDRCANFDVSKLEDASLREFIEDCREGNIE